VILLKRRVERHIFHCALCGTTFASMPLRFLCFLCMKAAASATPDVDQVLAHRYAAANSAGASDSLWRGFKRVTG